MSIQELWHLPQVSTNTLLSAAAHVCPHSETTECATVAAFLANKGITIRSLPVSVLGNKTVHCIYHHGGDYNVYSVGEPENILGACTMAENDREKALLESRRIAGGSARVLSVASGTLHHMPKKVSDINKLAFCGHISVV